MIDFTLPTHDGADLSARVDLSTPLAEQYPDAVALAAASRALFLDEHVSTAAIAEAAEREILRVRGSGKSTFVPIFLTNHCDSACKMCGMRADNEKLVRKFARRSDITDQLTILRDYEGVQGVGFLTGEYLTPYTRLANAFLVGWAIEQALSMGFQEVYFNIGSLDDDEIAVLTDGWAGDARVVMCVFQETYQEKFYSRFMGQNEEKSPKADFERRIMSFDRWLAAGASAVNPGFLVGLGPVEDDLFALVTHVEYLAARGARARISLPRLRPASGSSVRAKTDDEKYFRLVATVAYTLPAHPIVITTREEQAMQERLLPLIGVISPGSPDVIPYRRDTVAANSETSSQFIIPDLRHPREILARVRDLGYQINGWTPPTLPEV